GAICLLALLLRLAAVEHWGDFELRDTFDQLEYATLAKNLRFHGSLSYGSPRRWEDRPSLDATGPYDPTAARAPALPFMVALLWQGDAPPQKRAEIVHAVLGTMTVLLVYWLGLAHFGPREAIVASLMMALAPLSIFMTATLASETLFVFLFTAFLWQWMAR